VRLFEVSGGRAALTSGFPEDQDKKSYEKTLLKKKDLAGKKGKESRVKQR